MKETKNKQWEQYVEEGYAALAKSLLTYFQSYFPYYCGWMPDYDEYESKEYMDDAHLNKPSDKTIDKKKNR